MAPYARIAADLGSTESAVKQAARELRHEFGNVLRHEVGITVTEAGQVDEKIRYLLGLLRGS